MAVKSIFSTLKVDLIKRALFKTQEQSEQSWPCIAESIMEYAINDAHWDRCHENAYCYNASKLELPKPDRISDFANQNYGRFAPLTMIAIVNWLTHDNNQYSSLSLEKLHGMSMLPKTARYFAEYLYENTKETPDISVDQLENGRFILEKNLSVFVLTIHASRTQYLLPITLEEARKINPKRDIKSKNLTKNYYYGGWIIIAPNNGLFCMFKNMDEECNHLFIPIGIGDEALSNDPITSLIFMNQHSIEHYNHSNMNINTTDILFNWAENNKDNCLRFDRINEIS